MATSDNRVHLFRLQIIVIDGGLLVLRTIIDQILNVKGITLDACLKNEISILKSRNKQGVISQTQYDTLFPSSGKLPTTSDLDISLTILLLRALKCFGLNKKFDWNSTPKATDVSLEADIFWLKKIRNIISHMQTTTEIQAIEFTKCWNKIEQILVRQSPSTLNIQQKINAFKTCPLDPEEEERVRKEIEKWKDCEADVDHLKEEMKNVKKDLNDLMKIVDDLSKSIDGLKSKQDAKETSIQTADEKYKERKKYLKDDLVEFYNTRHSTVQLSPLFKETDTSLANFYIRPEINETLPGKKEVKSLSDVFITTKKGKKEIYLTADAGLGKTTFSKYLATSWCKANCTEEDMMIIEKDDIDCLQHFEFVFLVLLRDSYDLCSIDDLIYELIVSALAHSEAFDKIFLQEILTRENCLVILDGLDEWTHPDRSEKSCYKTPRSIPHRNDREKCTVLTTTRPWKYGGLDLTSNELGQHIVLTKLSYASTVTLTKRMLQRLRSVHDERSLKNEVDKFNGVIHAGGNSDLAAVPLLLMYIICLWCNDIKIGNSKCKLYVNIVELILARTTKNHGELWSPSKPPEGIPECFTGNEHCTKYFTLFMVLGKLAYHTLSSEEKENTLVFDKSLANTYLEPDDLKMSLLSGILTETTTKTLLEPISKVSFSHKTVQEFFAAIFISSESDNHEVLKKCVNVQSILDMSNVCQFVSRMNATRMREIWEGFMSVINKDEKIREYRTRTGSEVLYENPLYHIQNMLLAC